MELFYLRITGIYLEGTYTVSNKVSISSIVFAQIFVQIGEKCG